MQGSQKESAPGNSSAAGGTLQKEGDAVDTNRVKCLTHCVFVRVAKSKPHKLGLYTTDIYSLSVLEAEVWGQGVNRAVLPLKALGQLAARLFLIF